VARRRVPLRVVRMLPETRQVLLYDKNRGTHVVAEVGQDVEGYVVDEIADDEVTLISGNGAEIILTAPDASQPRRKADRKTAADAARTPAAATESPVMAPMDPYAEADATTAAPTVSPSPAAPVAPLAPVGTPSDPYANMDPGIAAFVEAVGATPATSTGAPVSASAPAPAAPAKTDAKVDAATALAAAATGTPAPVAAVAPPAKTGITISRSEVDTALADFGATAVTFDAAFVADGLRIDQIAKGTILGKLGLEKGDILTAVDNQPLHSLDDAANLYARAGTAKAATLHILRGGKPTTLKVTIR
jgi:membrane-associated protease RseP (regulator of RpoE activity)